MFHLLLIFSSLFFFGLSSANARQNPASNVLELKQVPHPQNADIKSAKYLEDYYWAYKSQKRKVLNNSLSGIKRYKRPFFKKFIPLLKEGLSENKKLGYKNVQSCSIKVHGNSIEKRYRFLYKRICLKNESNKLLKRTGSLSKREQTFIEQNWQYLSSYRFRDRFIDRLKELGASQKVFFSQVLRNYIFKTRKLPHKDLLQFLVVDKKITKFIQEENLFEHNHRNRYSREFSKLVKLFKQSYIQGNDEEAQSYLEQSIDFYELNKDKIDDSKAWVLFITSGKKIARQENPSLALDLFKMSEKTADHEQIHESKFQRLFTLYNERKINDAREFIREERLVEKYPELNSKLRFWIARTYQESKEYKKAKELYLQQIKHSPLSFYSIMALKNLRQFTPKYNFSSLISEDNFSFKDLVFTNSLKRELFYYKTFSKANSDFLSSIQTQQLRNLPVSEFFSSKAHKGDEKLKSYFLIKFFSQHDDHLASFKVAYTNLNKGKINLTPTVIESLFPNKYRNLVKAKSNAVDEKILLSLIRQESAFNEKARSIVGARGLMQIMPATGRQFIRNLKAHKLYNPELNVSIGAQYLEKLLRRYDGSLIFALAAYNAGMGNVGKWQRSIPFKDDEISNIEMIPFKETRNYVKLIYRNLFFYSYLDGITDHLDLPVNQSFKVALEN